MATEKFKDIFRKNDTLDEHEKNFEQNFNKFCQSITTDMELPLRGLIPGLTEDDIAPDTEGKAFVIEADPAKNP